MTEKLIFSIENAEMVNENPNSHFAVLSLDFFASGENLHEMYVSEDTLMRTADGIKNCPLVWKYDERLDDIYTHDKDEVPCGFVPENSKVESRKLPDGRTMLSVVAYVWKRYTGEILSFFKRDGGKKPVSVEMSVYKTKLLENGLTEILDYKYEAITILGSLVTPAIPLANASVLSFSQIKEEYKKDVEEEFSVRTRRKGWAQSIKDRLRVDKTPPIAVEQGIDTGEKEIKNFDNMEKNMDENKKVEEMAEVAPVEEKMAELPAVEEKMAEEVEKKETPSEEKLPEEKKFAFPKNFNMQMMEAIFADDNDEDDEDDEEDDEEIKMAKEEIKKGEFADPTIVMGAMFAKMCKMAEEKKVYMAENKELKKFKADVEEQQKQFAVELTLKELSERVIVPDDAEKEMISEAEKYSFSEIEKWKTYCKAKSFDFARKEAEKSDVVRVGMPFAPTTQKKKDDLWSS